MKTIKMKESNEVIYYEKLDNGLEVYLYNKDSFHSNYVTFTTKFGSIYNEFIPLGESKYKKVPYGVAHFLEHKVFEQENDPQPMEFFSETGAVTNAYTTFKNTTYLFSCSNNLIRNINYLLDFVQSPYFTTENVNEEKGIINEEINMCNDRPTDILYDEIRRNKFLNNNFKDSIIGTHKDIDEINKDILYTCYNTFYHPSNMMLFVVGNINPEELIGVIKENQNKKHFLSENVIHRLKIEEPTSVAVKEQIDTMQVEMNKLIVSIKINEILDDPQDKIKRELALNLLFDLCFSKSSSLYNEWLEKGYINETFSASFTQERDYAFILMGGDQDDYELLQKTIFNFIDHVQDLEIAEDDFERIKRKTIGNFINSYNSPESIANTFSRYYFEGICSFDLVAYVSKMTLADINEVKRYFNKEYASSYIVKKDK